MNFAVLVREINIKFQRCFAVAASLESERRKRRKVRVKGHHLRIIDQTCVCSVTSVASDSLRPYRLQPSRLRRAWDSRGRILEWVLQRTFLTQGSNVSCLLHWQVGSLPLTPLGKPIDHSKMLSGGGRGGGGFKGIKKNFFLNLYPNCALYFYFF